MSNISYNSMSVAGANPFVRYPEKRDSIILQPDYSPVGIMFRVPGQACVIA
ncbi:hypothetical protein ACFL6N_06635 [Thermodesulfobacteriota bacterium]